MTHVKTATVLLASLLGLWPALSPAQDQAQPRLPVVRLQVESHAISAEVASTEAQRMVGLMHRRMMGENQGMLFVYDWPAPQCFWMRNTLLPLTIAFIEDDGRIVNLADMQPRTDDSHCAARPVRYALEMNQGWFARRGLKAGSRLSGGPFRP
jgi:uncharacterized membrane protein (UPF0127 family)